MRMLYFDVPALVTRASGFDRAFSSAHCAEVAELADALASGASGRKAMKVRVLSSAPTFALTEHCELRRRLSTVARSAKVDLPNPRAL